jgi:hypothetical protein
MVFPGQVLERPALVDAGGVTLEALFHRGERPPALLLCPPLDATGMDAPALAELAWAAARAGHASLRFQHRGRGASQGAVDPGRSLDDAEAARRHLAGSASPRIAVAGLRSGCATALALAASAGLARVVIVAPEALPSVPPGTAALALVPELGPAVRPDALAAALAPGGGRVEVIPGADAAFRAGLPLVGRRALEWIEGR